MVFGGVGDALGFPGGITEFVFNIEEGPEIYEFDVGLALLSILLAAGGILIGGWFYWNGRLDRATSLAESQPLVYRAVKNKFYFDEVYQTAVDRGVLGFSYLVSWFDRYVVNDTGVDGSAQVTGYSGFLLKHLQTGRMPNYALALALGVVGLTFMGLVLRSW